MLILHPIAVDKGIGCESQTVPQLYLPHTIRKGKVSHSETDRNMRPATGKVPGTEGGVRKPATHDKSERLTDRGESEWRRQHFIFNIHI